MKLKELLVLVADAAAQGSETVLNATGLRHESLSKSDAYRIYGRSNIDRWLEERLIKISNKKINRSMLEAVAASSNRATYLPVADRS